MDEGYMLFTICYRGSKVILWGRHDSFSVMHVCILYYRLTLT